MKTVILQVEDDARVFDLIENSLSEAGMLKRSSIVELAITAQALDIVIAFNRVSGKNPVMSLYGTEDDDDIAVDVTLDGRISYISL